MTRRIVLTMLALVSALLITAVAPLGLFASGREQDSFRMATVMSAQTLAAVAEKKLSVNAASQDLKVSLVRASQASDEVWVYDGDNQVVARIGGARWEIPPVPLGTVVHVQDTGNMAMSTRGGELRVSVSVKNTTGGRASGVVVLARPTGPLADHLRMLWGWLIGVAAVGLLAAAALAIMVARWVGRPLSNLDAAAQRLGSGALDTRSATGHGPPEVRRLASTFNTMAGRLEALVHGNRAMMADVSHQLRTPLAALRLRLDLLAQDADQPTAHELADAQGEIARLSRLVDGLLAVARAENVVAKPAEVAVDAVIQDRAAAWRPVAEERGVVLVAGCPGPVCASLGEGHLEQILDNLLANALDMVPAGGQVKVSAAATGQGARVVVADDGPGMSHQQQEAAFRRFASTSAAGAGLGLAIVHRLVTSNGGAAALSDTPGGGLTVTLDLPGSQLERARRPGAVVGGRDLPFPPHP
ncbi:MAG TPA: HAMP domain-containing sensor histidine kinase [Streptosporangiaceae bacterium]|nr:HAMP domain-containing sensor histidine kinase [Streptosporangiaceae bacterium]